MFPDWVNVDRVDQSDYIGHLQDADSFEGWPESQRKLGEYIQAGKPLTVIHSEMYDYLGTLEPRSVDAIYLGQVIEHLNPVYQTPQVLARCFRVMKPGAMIRITTPDLVLLSDAWRDGGMGKFASEQPGFYSQAHPDMQLALLMFGAAGPECTQRNYEGHFCCYSAASLAWMLEGSQFEAPLETLPSQAFRDVQDQGMSHSLAMEATKPL